MQVVKLLLKSLLPDKYYSQLREFHNKLLFDLIKPTLGRIGSLNYDIKNTILVTGTPRSGTTWLAEILNTIPRSSILWEPLHVQAIPKLEHIGFRMHTYIPPGKDWPEAERYIRRVLEGKVLNRWTLSYTNLSQVLQTKRWIVKFCRANMLLKYITENFSISTPILLIRHPCAVVASQMRHGSWDYVSSPFPYCPEFVSAHPQFEDLLNNLETLEEMLAAAWCVENYVPLSQPKPYPWLVVTYEKLVRDGQSELQRIFQTLQLDMPPQAGEQLGIPSATTIKHTTDYLNKDPLSRWKDYLSPQQINDILRVVSNFGLDFYDDHLEPDYKRL